MQYEQTTEKAPFIPHLLSTHNDVALTILRLALGGVMFAHGAQKMLGWFGGPGYSATMGYLTGAGIPAFFAFLAIVAEFFGSLGLILGLLSRVAAFGIACVMTVAIVKVHSHVGFFMNWAGTQRGEGFEYHILALAIAVAIMISGAGAWSIDRMLARRAPR
jgi:putative oxidoreductase